MPNLLTAPNLVFEEELNKKISDGTWSMCWEFGPKQHSHTIRFGYNNCQTNLEIQWIGVLPAELKGFEKQFIKHTRNIQNKTNETIEMYTFTFGKTFDTHSSSNSNVEVAEANEGAEAEAEPYHLWEPRVFKKDQPIKNGNASGNECEMDLKKLDEPKRINTTYDLLEFLKSKSVLFYTGAGVSADSVPMMSKLESQLGFGNKNVEDFIKATGNIMQDPTNYIQIMTNFYRCCLFGKPSDGHQAISRLAIHKKTKVLSENLDLLHQRTGFEALMPAGKDFKTKETISCLTKIDVVVCIGLSHDDHGFLAWYKECNPQGKILSLNIDEKPANYLDKNDLFMVGDAQKVLPELVKRFDTSIAMDTSKKFLPYQTLNYKKSAVIFSAGVLAIGLGIKIYNGKKA